MPGALPVLNIDAVNLALKAGLALGCKINKTSVFSRKNYFYPDLPKGYQISQFDKPICGHGKLEISVNNQKKTIGITRIHMEEDAGKLVHQGADGIAGSTHSYVDLNRAGTPLIEIVSEPDLRSSEEARAYMETLREILQHMGVCDGNMEQGNLRADANVSIRPYGETTFGTRTEIKNLNSFRSLERAINVEVERQIKCIKKGEKIIQETRNFDDNTQTTTPLRGKEDAHDYRYFPEPDLPPLTISEEWLVRIQSQLPLLPEKKRKMYKDIYQLTDKESDILMSDVDQDRYFQEVVSANTQTSQKEIAKWVIGDVAAALKETPENFSSIKASPESINTMVSLIQKGTISGKMAKEMVTSLVRHGGKVEDLLEKMGGGQISDESEIMEIVKKVIDENPDVVEKIKNGKGQAAGFLVGQVMKKSQGKAKPDLVNKLIQQCM
jgi:aspartyl-tRNA(Asn)/glutamyl-tRNA(Gln) amidotransferase subunit B